MTDEERAQILQGEPMSISALLGHFQAIRADERERCHQSLAIYHENKHDAVVRDMERGDLTIEEGLKLAGQARAHRESAATLRSLGESDD